MRVLPYKQGSKGARALADALGIRVLKLRGSTWRPRPRDIVINWGSAEETPANLRGCTILNPTGHIRSASNKLHFFDAVTAAGEADIIPRFWTRREDIPADAYPIVCRTILAGHSGAGIVIAGTPADLVAAPLYVAYVKKQDEYRIHVGKHGDDLHIIAVQKKARRIEHENPNWQVRNHQNGFIYAREGVNPPEAVLDVAKRGLSSTALDFGAVDVIWNARASRAYVLEVNTAPGLEGQTVQDYAAFFRRFA